MSLWNSSRARPPVPLFAHSSTSQLINTVEKFDDLQVVGYSCDIYDDPQTALRLEKEEHLLLWMENKEENLLIDRYDARLLLEDRNMFSKTGSRMSALSTKEMEEEKMIDEERYRDLPPGDGSEIFDAPKAVEQEEPEPSRETDRNDSKGNEYGRVHFSFSEPLPKHEVAPPAPPVPEEIAKFAAGWLTDLPPGSMLPRTYKQHQVIEHTAKFVLKKGTKMEAMLKVKHGGSPAFAFLLIDNPLQNYYKAVLSYLRVCPEAADLPTLLPAVSSEAMNADNESDSPKAGAQSDGKDESNGKVEKEEGKKRVETIIHTSSTSAAVTQAQVDSMNSPNPIEPARPPEETYKTIEKLVEWIRKSGIEFEAKVREKQKGDPRFDFLLPWNPYNAYYRYRVASVMAESGISSTNRPEKSNSVATTQIVRKDSEEEDPHKITTVEAITSFGDDSHQAEEGQVDPKPSGQVKEPEQSEQKEEKLTAAEKKALRLQRAKMMAKQFEEKLKSSGIVQVSASTGSPAEGEAKQLGEETAEPEVTSIKPNDEKAQDEAETARPESQGDNEGRSKDENQGERGSKSRSRSRGRSTRESSGSRKSRRRDGSSKRRSRSRSGSRSRSSSRSRSISRSISRRKRSRSSSRKHKKSRSKGTRSRSRSRSRGKRSRGLKRSRSMSRSRSRSRDRMRDKIFRRNNSKSRSRSRSRSRDGGSKLKEVGKEEAVPIQSFEKDSNQDGQGVLRDSFIANISAKLKETSAVSDDLRSRVRAMLDAGL